MRQELSGLVGCVVMGGLSEGNHGSLFVQGAAAAHNGGRLKISTAGLPCARFGLVVFD